jgi:hypothetical protein
MKWIKLSEREPEIFDLTHYRIKRVNTYGNILNTYIPVFWYNARFYQPHMVEWLDESEPETLADINDEVLADLRNKMSLVLNFARTVIAERRSRSNSINYIVKDGNKVIDMVYEITKKEKPDESPFCTH